MNGSVLERGPDVKAIGPDVRAPASRELGENAAPDLEPLVDPRWGDVSDDAASTKQRSLLSIAGTLLVEISLPKLLFAWTVLLLLPAVLLGIAPLVAIAWLHKLSIHLLRITEIGAALTAIALIVLGTLVWRPLFRLAELTFWSLNAMAVQPGYALCREALRHLADHTLSPAATPLQRARVRAAGSAVAGIMLCGWVVLIAFLVWPASRWTGTVTDLVIPHRLVIPTLANAMVLVCGYTAIAALIWGFADASMEQPAELAAFDVAPPGACTWRIAHLSDLHVVAERYGFRIESGRGGPRGNDRVERVMTRLEAIHRAQPLDVLLVCGDMTDAGLSTEWAEFLDVVRRHPALASRLVVLPGNHDLNIVDRANPARLDLPLSIGKRLRQMRTLLAIAAVQGNRVHVVDRDSRKIACTLTEALAQRRNSIVTFMETGGVRRAAGLRGFFDEQFPMILPPETEEGLGIAILNSNAESHFSFTNALGLISLGESRRLIAAVGTYPKASWIIALHHHLIEYPMPGVAFSERLGTALVNGSWFVRKLMPFGVRTVIMHGHRHIDWIGTCGGLKIVSAPSPVVEGPDHAPTHFYIHTVATGPDGRLRLLAPERVEIDDDAATGTAH